AGLQLGDRLELAAVARQVLEQVADRVQAERLGALGRGRGLDLERLGEPPRARVAHRCGGELRVGQLGRRGERGGHGATMARGSVGRVRRYSAASSHHQLGWPPSEVSTSTPSGASVCTVSSSSGAPAPLITVTSSAPSATWRRTPRRAASGSPQTTISSPTNPTASPRLKRPCASSRAAGATPPARTCTSASFIAAAFSAAERAGSKATAAARPACWDRARTTWTVLSE